MDSNNNLNNNTNSDEIDVTKCNIGLIQIKDAKINMIRPMSNQKRVVDPTYVHFCAFTAEIF